MKHLLTLLLFLLCALPLPGWAQAPAEAPAATLNFCGVELPVSTGCSPISKSELTCATYSLSWWYLDFSVMKTYPAQYIRQQEKKHKGTEKQPFECSILDGPPAQGVRLSYPTETGGMAYELIVYGAAKGQPVLLDLVLPNDPEKTADLPAIAQQIMRLPK
jgi:hypothetical protein